MPAKIEQQNKPFYICNSNSVLSHSYSYTVLDVSVSGHFLSFQILQFEQRDSLPVGQCKFIEIQKRFFWCPSSATLWECLILKTNLRIANALCKDHYKTLIQFLIQNARKEYCFAGCMIQANRQHYQQEKIHKDMSWCKIKWRDWYSLSLWCWIEARMLAVIPLWCEASSLLMV